MKTRMMSLVVLPCTCCLAQLTTQTFGNQTYQNTTLTPSW